MKLFLLLSAISIIILSADKCGKKSGIVKYKGRLEIAGICMNYTIKVLEGRIDTSRIASRWTDEVTGKSYMNVFALQNPCYFPSSIKQGDEFYFYIDTAVNKGCLTCLAYYPKPSKKLSITVIEK
jgi:hypothetical protein